MECTRQKRGNWIVHLTWNNLTYSLLQIGMNVFSLEKSNNAFTHQHKWWHRSFVGLVWICFLYFIFSGESFFRVGFEQVSYFFTKKILYGYACIYTLFPFQLHATNESEIVVLFLLLCFASCRMKLFRRLDKWREFFYWGFSLIECISVVHASSGE